MHSSSNGLSLLPTAGGTWQSCTRLQEIYEVLTLIVNI